MTYPTDQSGVSPDPIIQALDYLDRHYPNGGAPVELIDRIHAMHEAWMANMVRLCRTISGDPDCCADLITGNQHDQ